MEYGRNVSEAEVKKAEFLNFLRAPKEIQTAMSRFDPSSSGYNKMQNLAASARYDAEQANARSGAVRQVGTDGVIRNIAGSGGGATDGQVNRAFAERLPPELTRALSPQGDADRAARRAERQPQAPVNAMGFEGATFGEINGQKVLVPQAGQYGRYMASTGGQGAISQEQAGQIQAGRQRQQALAEQQAFQRELTLKGEPERIRARATIGAATTKANADLDIANQRAREAGAKAERELYAESLRRHNNDIGRLKSEYQREQNKRKQDETNVRTRVGYIVKGLAKGQPLILPDGTQIPKEDVEGYFLAKHNINQPLPDFETWARDARGFDLNPPQNPFNPVAAAATPAAPSTAPDFKGIFGNGKTDEENFQALRSNPQAKATAVQRLREKGLNAQADYIAGL